jgi:tripartite-type tricarboxylate transporter receptor subunit TctC
MYRVKWILHIISAVVAVLLAGAGIVAAQAQTYPMRAVRIMVPYSTGSATDVLTRVIAQKLTDAWGQSVVVDNQPGANGIPGTATVAKAPPDGYALIMIAANHVVNASLYSKLPYDTVKDFRPIVRVGQVPFVLCVHPALPVKTLKEFIALAKLRPGEINYASPGNGTPGHLSMEMLKTMAGINVVHVPYKGAAQALTDVLGGQVPASFIVVAAAIPQIRNGKLRPLAISSALRSPQLPEVASVAELGYQGFDVVSWIGLAGPAALPNDIVNKIGSDVLKVIQQPDARDRILATGVEIVPAPADEFAAYVVKEHAKWAKVVKDSGAKLD